MYTRLKRLLITGISILSIVALAFAVHFAVVQAQDPEGSGGNLVPCGTSANPTPCNLCDLYVLVKRVINFLLFGLALPIAVVMMLIGGMYILTSMGSEENIKKGKAAIYNTLIGAAIAFAAWLVINTILTTLGFKFTWTTIPVCQAPIVTAPTITGGIATATTGTTGGGTTSTTSGGASGTGGSCEVMQDPNNPCAPSRLQQSCSAWDPQKASQICNFESSGGDVSIPSSADVTDNAVPGLCNEYRRDGRCPFSFGLFQVGLHSNDLGHRCPSIFHYEGSFPDANGVRVRHYTFIDTPQNRDIYKLCVATATNATMNVQVACRLYSNGGFDHWRYTVNRCRI